MPANLFGVIHYDAGLKKRLDRVMPGAHWQPWLYGDADDGVYETSLRVSTYLNSLHKKGVHRVSSRQAKADLEVKDMPSSSWTRARDMGLESVPWQQSGQWLETMFQSTQP